MFKAIDLKPASEAGTRLGEFFASQVSEDLLAYLEEQTTLTQSVSVQKLAAQTVYETRDLSLNVIKRLKLLGAFRSVLLQYQFPEETIEKLVSLLVKCLSNNFVFAQEQQVTKAHTLAAPDPGTSASNSIDELLNHRRFEEALPLLREAYDQRPKDLGIATNLATALLELSNYAEGITLLEKIVAVKPAFITPYLNLGSSYLWRGDFNRAKTQYLHALRLAPRNPQILFLLGLVLVQEGGIDEAIEYYNKALALDADHVETISALGSVYSIQGDKDKAIEQFERALALKPDHIPSICSLLSLRSDAESNAKLATELNKLIQGSLSLTERVSANFTLGEYYDRLKKPKLAFSYFHKGNELRKLTAAPYEPVMHRKFASTVVKIWDSATIEASVREASPSDRPVFVVGMMRSGTSLVEQILASHPKVFGAGELDFWHQAYLRDRSLIESGLPKEKTIKKLAKAYLRTLSSHSPDALRVVDKATFNVNYLGLIHKVFPRAKIICLWRNPLDVCLSCYFQNFTNAAAFSMDLESLANYYRQHHRIVKHWADVLPRESFLQVPYEQLVVDQKQWSQRMLEFIGLDWDPGVLEFQKTQRAVRTASIWQVRKPLYSSAIGRWRAYERFISPLLPLQELYHGDKPA